MKTVMMLSALLLLLWFFSLQSAIAVTVLLLLKGALLDVLPMMVLFPELVLIAVLSMLQLQCCC